jgi:hypothetical protein
MSKLWPCKLVNNEADNKCRLSLVFQSLLFKKFWLNKKCVLCQSDIFSFVKGEAITGIRTEVPQKE